MSLTLIPANPAPTIILMPAESGVSISLAPSSSALTISLAPGGVGNTPFITTVSDLTTRFPSPVIGQPAVVTDAVSCVFGAGVTGGATGVPGCPVYWNGRAWVAG